MVKVVDSERVFRLIGGYEIVGCMWDERYWNISCCIVIMIGIRWRMDDEWVF